MIFGVYNSATVAYILFEVYFFGNLMLGFMPLLGLASGADLLSVLAGCIFIFTTSVLSLNKTFRASPFSILFCYFTFLYLAIPVTFILVKGGSYIFGLGLSATPFNQQDYVASLPIGLIYLSVLWTSVWFGLISNRPNRVLMNREPFSKIQLKYLLLLGGIVFIVSWIENQSFNVNIVDGTENAISIIAFVFFDRAYLVLAGVILFFKLNEAQYLAHSRIIIIITALLFIGFALLHFTAGSKAAILVTFTLFVLYPFCLQREYRCAKVNFPKPSFLIVMGLFAVPMFYFALIQRISIGSGVIPDMRGLLEGIAKTDMTVVYDVIDQVFYRLSWGGVDRFLLIVQSFVVTAPGTDASNEFVYYLAKNTVNLLLPGTPYQEAYAPSSQLFSQVIENNPLNGNMGKAEYLQNMNTQPYTLFGIFIIIFGWGASFVLYISVYVFVAIYKKIRDIFIKITMIYFFSAALTSFGIETVLAGSLNFYVSLLLMYFLIKILSRFRIKGYNFSKSSRSNAMAVVEDSIKVIPAK